MNTIENTRENNCGAYRRPQNAIFFFHTSIHNIEAFIHNWVDTIHWIGRDHVDGKEFSYNSLYLFIYRNHLLSEKMHNCCCSGENAVCLVSLMQRRLDYTSSGVLPHTPPPPLPPPLHPPLSTTGSTFHTPQSSHLSYSR